MGVGEDGGGVGSGKGTGKSMRKLCRNYPLANYPLVSPYRRARCSIGQKLKGSFYRGVVFAKGVRVSIGVPGKRFEVGFRGVVGGGVGGKTGSICHFAISLVLQRFGVPRYQMLGKTARKVSCHKC